MDATLRAFLESGRKLITDSKTPRMPQKKKQVSLAEATGSAPAETDPHKIFVKRTIDEKPKKSELLKDIHKFIVMAEKDL